MTTTTPDYSRKLHRILNHQTAFITVPTIWAIVLLGGALILKSLGI